MAIKTTVYLCLATVFLIKQASGYYCDSDKCSVDEYCCGDNFCCTSYAVWQMWYFWCGLVFFVFLLSACAGFCKYRFYHTAIIIHGSAPYSRLEDGTRVYTAVPTEYNDKVEKYAPMDPPTYTPNYPPPAYTPGVDKDPSYKR